MWTAVLLGCIHIVFFTVYAFFGCEKKKQIPMANNVPFIAAEDPRAKSAYGIKTETMFPGLGEQKQEALEALRKEEEEALKKALEEQKQKAAAKT
ncbi:hypothetical protein QR680_018411 [Steinernema hermaphroditum]|uniref:Uncharacterized protein n=1 Tax=Steinernema hermaphroditum TaxID=289476 RepID=A0AA39LQZ5_9BILA|nr:hypothetical protein QR680_018411 [Steinernema hermaphroditum]